MALFTSLRHTRLNITENLKSDGNTNHDGEIQVRFTIKKDFQTAAGEIVYFRVKDPADASPYLSGATANDNNGGDKTTTPKRPATLGGNGVAETSAGSGIWSAQSGTDGLAQVILQIPGSANNAAGSTNMAPAAGDNYVIEASFDQNFSSGLTVASSIITDWKRVYLEQDKMLVSGGLLKQDANPGDTVVTVYNWATLPTCANPAPPWKKGKNPSPCYQIVVFDSGEFL